MIRIAVCEDELVQAEYIGGLLKNWQNRVGIPLLVDVFHSAEQFVFETEEASGYDILLLDIQMGEMNGMELAKRVREKDKRVRIIFLTGVADYAIEGYEVGAIRYLLKPVKEEVLSQLLSAIYEEFKKEKQDCFVFTVNGRHIRLPYQQIFYVEAKGHYLFMQTEDTTYEWKASLMSISQELEARAFFLLRRGLYVNVGKLVQIGSRTCMLENGETLPVSKSRYKELNQAFIAYYKGE